LTRKPPAPPVEINPPERIDLMKSYPTLPQGYVPFATIDLVHNKKQFWIVNGLSVALCVIMLILPFLWGRSLRDIVGEGSLSALLLRLVAMAGIFAYIALHELTHGAVMKACGASVRYGYKVVYAYAGSDAYFTRPAYVAIALAPVVVFARRLMEYTTSLAVKCSPLVKFTSSRSLNCQVRSSMASTRWQG